MYRLTARCGGYTSRVLRDVSGLREVTALPRGMHRFQPPPSHPVPFHETSATHSDANTHPLPTAPGDSCASGVPRLSSSSSPVLSPPEVASGNADVHSRRAHLPPWPVDNIEFNALLVDGGHGARAASERNAGLQLPQTSLANAGDSHAAVGVASLVGRPSVPKIVMLTPDALRRLAKEEESPAAQAALAAGGWVCTGCWTVQEAVDVRSRSRERDACTTRTAEAFPSPAVSPRTVCPSCHVLRHDIRSRPRLAALRAQPHRWMCGQCGEVNAEVVVGSEGRSGEKASASPQTSDAKTTPSTTGTCRCCGASRASPHDSSSSTSFSFAASARGYQCHTIADELAAEAVGHIVVTRNRTTRWRCSGCNEINSLQLTKCRNCAQERFALTVCCPQCEASRVLTNALVYRPDTTELASGAQTAAAASKSLHPPPPLFSPSNCYRAASTQLTCLQCRGPLHGGVVRSHTHGSAPWWCACGVVNPSPAYSCYRCRLPRTVSSPVLLSELLRSAVTPTPQWDFANCTNWFCDSCEGVNRAAYEAIVAHAEATTSSAASSSSPPVVAQKRRRWVDDGDVACRHCTSPWHHQRLQGGGWWRCACHAVNKREDSVCTSCRLPARDHLTAIVLSAWSRGDWLCDACGTHCYRDRMRCRCGADRPVLL